MRIRKINPQNFRVATRGTSREINRRIALDLVRTHQPLSRADLARRMGLHRGAVSLIVNDLLGEGVIFEGMMGESLRGRKPTFLYIETRERCVAAVDIRVTRTYLMIADPLGRTLVATTSFPTEREPKRLISGLSRRIKRVLADHPEVGVCEGIGVVVPGMVDRATSRIIHAPTMGWRDVELRESLSAATGLPVQIENSGKACALAQMWGTRGDAAELSDLVFVSVSDGVGVGVIVNGEILRGRHNIAGEFGHVPLSIDGPRCACGATGCWEAYISNLATLSRYFGRNLRETPVSAEVASFTIEDLITRARAGDGKAIAAMSATARYLGLGLASIVNAVDPARIYIGGEIIAAWDLIESAVRVALSERALSPDAAETEIRTVSLEDWPRLRGAAALVTAPAFAAPAVA